MGRTTQIMFSKRPSEQENSYTIQSVISPSGTRTNTTVDQGSVITQTIDFTSTRTTVDDVRFGKMSPFLSGLNTYSRQIFRTQTELWDGSNIFPIQSLKIDSSLTSPENKISTTTYDGPTRTYTVTSSLGRIQKTITDDFERPTSIKVGNLTPTTFTYTGDKLTKKTQGSRTTILVYDPSSQRLSSVTDPLTQTTQFTYDTSERLTGLTLADGRVITYGYDSNGNLISVTPAGKPIHNLVQNVYEDLSQYQSPKVGTQNNVTVFNYNLDKQLTKVTRPDGKVIDYNYDSETGLLASQTSGSNTYTYGYGYFDKITRANSPLGINILIEELASFPSVIHFGTSSLSNIFLQYTRDETLKINQLTFQDATLATKTFAVTYDHDEFLKSNGSAVITYSFPNGTISNVKVGTVSDAFTYDTFGGLKSQTSKAGTSTLYTYTITPDLLGRVSTLSETIQGTTTSFDYTYDVTGRLKTVKVNGVQKSIYNYDTNNNILNGTRRAAAFTSTFDTQDRILTTTGKTIATNAAGEVTKITTTADGKFTSFSYDAFGQLTKVTLPSAKVIEYGMDGFHRRGYRKSGATITDYYLYDENSRVVATLTASGAFKSVFLYASKSHVPEYFVTGSTKYKVVTDYLGSVRLVVRTSDNVVMQRMDYDEWGNVINDTKPGFQPFGFAGGLYDSETKLVRFGVREYEPSLGRWLSKDPIRFDGGDTNLYGYVVNDPVNWVDPEGLYRFGPGAKGPLSPGLDTAMQCFDSCTGRDTVITSGRDSHKSSDPHMRGDACDVGRNSNPDLSQPKAKQCFEQCFTSQARGQEEQNGGPGTHFHFQLGPDLGGNTGFSPNIAPHGR